MTLLPPNSTALERRFEATHEIKLNPSVILKLWNPWTCPLHLLPQLAWSLSVDEWDDDWDEATQRKVVATSAQIHRLKGTAGAVRLAMASQGHDTKMVEWWQTVPKGRPYTFIAEVNIDQRGMSGNVISSLERQINRAKNVRSHYSIRLVAQTRLDIRIGCAVLSGETVEVRPLQLTEIQIEPAFMTAGVGGQDWATVTIYPKTTS